MRKKSARLLGSTPSSSRAASWARVLRRGSDDEEIGEAFDVPELGGRQGQAEQADEGDDRRGTPYNGFHGTSGLQDWRTGC